MERDVVGAGGGGSLGMGVVGCDPPGHVGQLEDLLLLLGGSAELCNPGTSALPCGFCCSRGGVRRRMRLVTQFPCVAFSQGARHGGDPCTVWPGSAGTSAGVGWGEAG